MGPLVKSFLVCYGLKKEMYEIILKSLENVVEKTRKQREQEEEEQEREKREREMMRKVEKKVIFRLNFEFDDD